MLVAKAAEISQSFILSPMLIPLTNIIYPSIMKPILFLLSAVLILISCKNSNNSKLAIPSKIDSGKTLAPATSKTADDSIFEMNDRLTSMMHDTVQLDSLLNKITHQEKVKLVAELKSVWDDTEKVYKYFDSNFLFKLKFIKNKLHHDNYDAPSALIDGKHQINFANYQVTCFNSTHCLSYGYNASNSLENPKIIEVCGKRFLYSDMAFECNGKGCGCVLTMIYDLATRKPTFIENYRIRYEGFFISDFDNDNNPDLLVIEKTNDETMRGFETVDFEVNLYAYSYVNGKFIPTIDNQYLRPYSYTLYGIGEYGCYTYLTYSILTNNWFRL